MACPSPLKPEHCTTLNVILQSVADTKQLIDKCKECGLPVEDEEARNAMQGEVAATIKRLFFPNNA